MRVVGADRQPGRLRVDPSTDAGGAGEFPLQSLVLLVPRGAVSELGLVSGHPLAERLVDGGEAVRDAQPRVGHCRATLAEDLVDSGPDGLGL
ncbi:hypothetical protein [Streptomyces sp. NBC_00987]|uniref:hypothetical protein n=1 Tax=Streptomyces sp. NBC_00987 TaxID=2903703 RepID=UPI003869D7C0|nr:hypothetical protein OG355_41555 [Streptomyces sp. NBC_00987]